MGQNNSWANRINTVTLFVEDLETTKQFYKKFLGFQ